MLKLECANNKVTKTYIRNDSILKLLHLHAKKIININLSLTKENSSASDALFNYYRLNSVFDLDKTSIRMKNHLQNNSVYGAYSSNTYKGSSLYNITDGHFSSIDINGRKFYIEGRFAW